MAISAIGDLAWMLTQRSHHSRLNADLVRLTKEFANGTVSDITRHLSGETSVLAGLERGLSRLDAFDVSVGESLGRANAVQLHLEKFSESGEKLRSSILSLQTAPLSMMQSHIVSEGRASLEDAIVQMNASSAGRHLFSGTATDRAPFPSAETILNQLRLGIASAADANAVLEVVDTWIAEPEGFSQSIYLGSQADQSATETAEGHRVSLGVRADERALVESVVFRALAVVVSTDSERFSSTQRRDLFIVIADRLGGAQDGISEIQADIGFSEARLEKAQARQGAERFALTQARNALVKADPFATATELQSVQQSLESLFAVTARNAKLSLLGFLR